jgi:prevent-host-death family protein
MVHELNGAEYGAKLSTMRASAVKPITYMKTHSAELVAEVNKRRGPVVITQSGAPRAVLMDVDSYERMQDALILLKLISHSEVALKKGRWRSQPEMEQELRKRFGD